MPESPTALAEALRSTGYLADEGLAAATYLDLRMGSRCSANASRAPDFPRQLLHLRALEAAPRPGCDVPYH